MRRLVAVTGICLLLTAGAVSCSGDGGEKPGGKARPDASGAVKAVRPPDQPGPLVDLIAKQVRAAGTVRADLVEQGSQGGERVGNKVTGQLRTNTPAPVAQMTIIDSGPDAPGTIEAVLSGGVIHVRVDGEEQEPGKPWARLSREDLKRPELGPFAGVLGGLMDQVDQAMREIATDTGLALVRHGTLKTAPAAENVQGTMTRKYAGITKTSAMASDPAYKAMAGAGLKEIPWTLWIDDKALPRQFTVALSAPKGTEVSTTVTYRDWGGPVLIQTPPADKVSRIGA